MVKNIVYAAGVAVLVLSGCTPRLEGTIGIRTDANGRHAKTFVVKSTGDEEIDKRAIYAAAMSFRRQVLTPEKNHLYHVPVSALDKVKPLYSVEKKPN